MIVPPAHPGPLAGHTWGDAVRLARDYGVIAVELGVLYVLYSWVGRLLGFEGIL